MPGCRCQSKWSKDDRSGKWTRICLDASGKVCGKSIIWAPAGGSGLFDVESRWGRNSEVGIAGSLRDAKFVADKKLLVASEGKAKFR